MDAFAVVTGAAAGALARHYTSRGRSPWATCGINIAGSFILGAVVTASSLNPRAKLLAGTGFCGAFTTFSTFSVETVRMWEAGQAGRAVGFVAANNVGSIAAAATGALVCARLGRGRTARLARGSAACGERKPPQ